MYIINTTFVADRTLLDELHVWLTEIYLPEITTTGTFVSHRLARVITNQDPETVSIACEVTVDSISAGAAAHSAVLDKLSTEIKKLWGDKVLYFTTVLREM